MENLVGDIWKPAISYYREAIPVRQAIREYDSRLEFGFHPKTGQWVAVLNHDLPRHPDGPMIVMAWNEIPSPEAATKRLYNADARRHGTKMLEALDRHNANLRREHARVADDAIGQTAEQFEYAYRKEGAHPTPRIFVPRSA